MHLLSVHDLCTLCAISSFVSSVNITLLQHTAALDSDPKESSLNPLQQGVITPTQQERHKNIQKEGKEIIEHAL